MDAPSPHPWIRTALLAGLAYLVIGRVFALPAGHVQMWRLAAWVASGAVFIAHLGHERIRLNHLVRATAAHAALGVAFGALGLAVAGMVHSLTTGAPLRAAWLLALVAWPAITAIPAFLAGLAAAAVLGRLAPASREKQAHPDRPARRPQIP